MSTQASLLYALSIKQPWAALVVQGLKTIEIRRWPTARRGRILIHAARIPDARPEAWRQLPADLLALAQLQGGVIGSVDLTDCLSYHDQSAFDADQTAHRNEPAWFEPPLLYGFKFAEPKVLPFHKYPGWFRFFKIPNTSSVSVHGK